MPVLKSWKKPLSSIVKSEGVFSPLKGEHPTNLRPRLHTRIGMKRVSITERGTFFRSSSRNSPLDGMFASFLLLAP